MSGEDSNNNNDNASLMEMMQAMMSSFNNIDLKVDNNMSSLNNNMNNLREDLNSSISQSSEQIHMRMEALQEKINSRSNSKANSRAVSPSALASRLNAKVKEGPLIWSWRLRGPLHLKMRFRWYQSSRTMMTQNVSVRQTPWLSSESHSWRSVWIPIPSVTHLRQPVARITKPNSQWRLQRWQHTWTVRLPCPSVWNSNDCC